MTSHTPDELLASSKRRLQVSDHFLTTTYPTVQDPKLLMNVLDGILKAVEEMIDAVLIHERTNGRIPAYHDTFAGKVTALKINTITKKYGLTHIDTMMVTEMQELLRDHKNSAVEFPRKGALVVADDDFRLHTVTIEKIKTYLSRSKTLYTKIHDVLTRDTTVSA